MLETVLYPAKCQLKYGEHYLRMIDDFLKKNVLNKI